MGKPLSLLERQRIIMMMPSLWRHLRESIGLAATEDFATRRNDTSDFPVAVDKEFLYIMTKAVDELWNGLPALSPPAAG